jgi:hypothetical protein
METLTKNTNTKISSERRKSRDVIYYPNLEEASAAKRQKANEFIKKVKLTF